ncbi:hypothetical protein L2D14_08115 [Thalassospiraceae bacterium LMO-JJ14]|nr:hypothetical protein L2D14_08115 [Thalassospiraceae bacterium LMO-JJ14]
MPEMIIPHCCPWAAIVVNSCFLNKGCSRDFDKALVETGATHSGTLKAQGNIIIPPVLTRV